jgi:hypothetical protein
MHPCLPLIEADSGPNVYGSTGCVYCQMPLWMLIDRSLASALGQLNTAIQQALQNGQSVNVVISGGALAFAADITQSVVQSAQPFGVPVFLTLPSGNNTLTVALNDPSKNFLQYGSVTDPNTAACDKSGGTCALSYIAPKPLGDFELTLWMAGQVAGVAINGKTIALWYGGSALGGFALAYASGGIVTEMVDLWLVGHQGAINTIVDFAQGYATPYFPQTIVGSAGYAFGLVVNSRKLRK